MKKNNKGFTLIELLAVIVVLAIIMVIATQQVNKTISKSRSNSFIESYQMIVKQVKTFIASDENPVCNDNCLTYYDLSDKDYESLKVEETTGGSTGYRYRITLTGNKGKFANLNLRKYGDVKSDSTAGDWNCKISGSTETSCNDKEIIGYVEY